MNKYLPILSRCPLFRDVAADDIPAMLTCLGARVRACEKGEWVMHAGDRAEQVGILLDGKLEVVREDMNGGRTVVASVGAGEIFAETFACAGTDRMPVGILCIEKSVVMLTDIRRILHTCSGACAFHQQTVMNLLRGMAEKTLLLNRKMFVMSRRTTREKLLAYLSSEAERQQKTAFTVPFDRQSLADYLGVERSALSAEIGRMKRDGLIDANRSHFVLYGPDEHM